MRHWLPRLVLFLAAGSLLVTTGCKSKGCGSSHCQKPIYVGNCDCAPYNPLDPYGRCSGTGVVGAAPAAPCAAGCAGR